MALVTSAPKSELPFVHSSCSKPGAAYCPVVTRPIVFFTPVGLVKYDAPSSVRALRLTSANRTRSSTWLLGAPAWSCRRVTTSSRLSTYPAATLTAFSMTSLLEAMPASTMFLPLLCTSIFSLGNRCLICSVSRARSR